MLNGIRSHCGIHGLICGGKIKQLQLTVIILEFRIGTLNGLGNGFDKYAINRILNGNFVRKSVDCSDRAELQDIIAAKRERVTIGFTLGIKRTTEEYKADCDNLHRDWYNPKLRAKALLYNYEDVENLQRMKELLYATYYIPTSIEDECTLQLTQADKDKFKTRK